MTFHFSYNIVIYVLEKFKHFILFKKRLATWTNRFIITYSMFNLNKSITPVEAPGKAKSIDLILWLLNVD